MVSQEHLPGLRDLLAIVQLVVGVQEYLQRCLLRLTSFAHGGRHELSGSGDGAAKIPGEIFGLTGKLQERRIVRLLLESCFRRTRRFLVLFRAQVELRSFLETVVALFRRSRFGFRELFEQRARFGVLVLLSQNVGFVLADLGLFIG
jgi:hypothetical protein